MAELGTLHADTRRRREAARPKEIVEAAFKEFSRNGYATTTLNEIAERAGVT
jgi:AcrR family transcriptional regulator